MNPDKLYKQAHELKHKLDPINKKYNYKEAIELFQKANTLYKENNDRENVIKTFNQILKLYLKLDIWWEYNGILYDKALFTKSIDDLNYLVQRFKYCSCLEHALRIQEMIGDIYIEECKHEDAIEIFEDILSNVPEQDKIESTRVLLSRLTINSIRLKVAKSSVLINNYFKASELLDKIGRENLPNNNAKEYFINSILCLIINKDFKKAYELVKEYKVIDKLNSSINNYLLLFDLIKVKEENNSQEVIIVISKFNTSNEFRNQLLKLIEN